MKLPAGKYFVGDPCYVYDGDWSEYCKHIFKTDDGHFVIDGTQLFCASTAHGDGCYDDQNGNFYSVDAGIIGATHESVWKIDENLIKEQDLGQVVEFDKPFECSVDAGVIFIGHIAIDTGKDDEDEFCPECDMHYEECVCEEWDEEDEYEDEEEY